MCFQNKTTEGEMALPEGVSTTNTAATHSFRAWQSSCFNHFIRCSFYHLQLLYSGSNVCLPPVVLNRLLVADVFDYLMDVS